MTMRPPNRRSGHAEAPQGAGLNGDASALLVDRAIGELRRGRSIAITAPDHALVFAPIETISSGLLQRLIDASPETRLILTAARVRAGHLAAQAAGPMGTKIPAGMSLVALRTLAGMTAATGAPAQDLAFTPCPGDGALVLAAFGLTKAAKLVPALIGFQTPAIADQSLHRVTLSAILEYAAATTSGMHLISESRVPLAGSEASRVALFRDEYGRSEHVAVIIGAPDLAGSVPVRLHSACLTGDLLGSLRCDCGEQLHTAVERIAELGGGVLLYLDQEGRSIGLANKLRAYAIQDTGVDTFDANRQLGFDSDERSYDIAAAMLQQLGISRVKLLTNNPLKIDALREHGIDVEDRLPLIAQSNPHNEAYLRSKRERGEHLGD
jgi:GTP cyclohydrolase II